MNLNNNFYIPIESIYKMFLKNRVKNGITEKKVEQKLLETNYLSEKCPVKNSNFVENICN